MTSLVKEGSHLGGRILRGAAIIPIVLLTLPQSADTQEAVWTVDETPALSIGGEGSGPASELYNVMGAVRLENGRIIVLDRTPRILVFDADGSHLRTFGGRGQGPGEFQSVWWLQRLPGDTLLVFDFGNGRRLSYFTADSGFVRSVRSLSVPSPTPVGALSDGTLLATLPIFVARPVNGGEARVVRDQIELLRLDADASVLNSLATLPGSEALDAVGITAVGGRLQFGGSTAPFRNTLIVIGADNIYVATGDRFEILVFPPEGGSPDVISKDYELRPLTLDDFIEFLAGTRYADRIPDRSIRDWPKDQTRPAIVSLQVDDDGNLWAEEGREDPYAASIWSVFDPSGAYITKVTMPLRFRPFDIRTESVLGVWRDDLDVEYVQLRAIVKTNNQ